MLEAGPPTKKKQQSPQKKRKKRKKKGGTVPSTNCQQQGGGPLHQPLGGQSPSPPVPLVDTNQAVTLPSPHPGLTPAPSAPSVVSVGSSPFHGAPVSATQLCEVPDGEPAPVTPEWMLHAPLQPAEAGPADDACPVCLCVVLPCSVGPEARYEWPSCGHSLHLGCVAHLSVNSRAMSCPVCRSGWSVYTFMRQCREQRVSLPQVAPSYSTRSVPSPASPPGLRSRVVLPASRVGGRVSPRICARLGRATFPSHGLGSCPPSHGGPVGS